MAEAIAERSPGGRYVRFMEKLGSGASKDVYRAYDTQEGIEVAWNVVNLSGVPKNERNRIVNEVKMLERLHHNNIISFYGSWVNRHKHEVHFICEILSSGSLKSFITRIQVVRWKVAKRWAFQILKGLQYLHSQGVIHRDLKCDNIFINGTSGDLRIGDLGLSTVHRNGRVLSVLGTPEFIAPDMYEDRPYDYKVDIYSFGMCMLEIFTKDIPYRECSNPAQIYRKVSRGELPASLGRIRSQEGKDFIMFCLGHKDQTTGEYVRPTAEKLLAHAFFSKRQNDDGVVLVDENPLGELLVEEENEIDDAIMSTLGSVEESNNSSSKSTVVVSNPLLLRQQVQYQEQRSKKSASELAEEQGNRSAEFGEEGGEEHEDQLLDMPENEQNFRKVKVMMGRDKPIGYGNKKNLKGQKQPIPNDSTATATTLSQTSLAGSQTSQSSQEAASRASHSTSGASSRSQLSQAPEKKEVDAQESKTHYLAAAAVIKNEDLEPGEQLFADNYLKLIITLPIQGQTQNVQFDFHLVEDDSIQVAKEMVEELGIPAEAVLEISETISGLARAARMQRDNSLIGADASSNNSSNQHSTQSKKLSSTSLKGSSITSSNSSSSGSVSTAYRQQQQQNPIRQHQQQHRGSNRLRANVHQHQQHNAQQRHSQSTNQRQQYNHQQYRQQQQRHQQYGGQMLQQQPSLMRQQRPRLERRMSGDLSERGSERGYDKDAELRRLEEEYQQNLLEANQQFDSNINSLKRSVDKNEEEHLKAMVRLEQERAKYSAQMQQDKRGQDERLNKLRDDYETKRAGASRKQNDDFSTA